MAFIFGAVYVYHTYIQPEPHQVYDTNRLRNETTNNRYTVETYSGPGKLISHIHVTGLDVSVSNTGNLSGGRRALMDTVVVRDTDGNRMDVSGSTVVAFPKGDKNLIHANDMRGRTDKPIINTIVDRIPVEKRYGSKILLVKTYNESPVYACYGKTVKSFYSNIDNTEVFQLDGKPIFVFRGEFSISDATIFSE